MSSIIELKGLEKTFSGKRKKSSVTILRNINIKIEAGETLCVVGESGCGKTTLGRIIAGLLSYTEGSYLFDGKEVKTLKGKDQEHFRNNVQLIHQNPYESLNPTMMVYDIIANPIKRHKNITKTEELYAEVTRILDLVGLTPVTDFVDKYPNHLSGGQRQRVSIARALAMNPKLIVVDEATSMIDTSLRISLLQTLKNIQNETNVSFFFITHDLALGRYFSQGEKIMVMYLGEIIETALTDDFVENTYHPYSKALLSAAVGNSDLLERSSEFENYNLEGADIPSFYDIPEGCSLHPRCPAFMEGICDRVVPKDILLLNNHMVKCHLYDEEYNKK
ncbi:MAG TPA: ABC transporter ATP-binding protein [Proteiniclasticum sp.]|nr:ABC transporter ATP-binding protein [Proteiniclasticum sp.]